MTNAELAARQIVLEAFAVSALALALNIVGNKLTKRQMINLTDGVMAAALGRLDQESDRISSAGRSEGLAYLLLSGFSERLLPAQKAGPAGRKNPDK